VKILQSSTDSRLIERCIQNDQAAWSELIARYERLVYSVARVLCPPDDVSDVFQQVWVEVHKELSKLRNVQALPAWLMTLTRRRAYALIRSRRTAEPLTEELPDLSERLGQVEREHMIELALARLEDRCRKLIGLLYFDSTAPSYAKISQILGMPKSSIGPTRARCLEKLRRLIA
jgi:RNA polymerase sigma factor (sigma-70 family)